MVMWTRALSRLLLRCIERSLYKDLAVGYLMIREMDFPTASQINGKEKGVCYQDAFTFSVTKSGLSAVHVYHGIFAHLPKPVQIAMKVRNSIVKWFGFSAGDTEMSLALEDIKVGARAGFLVFEVVAENEIITAAYDKNMDMWLSVMRLSDQQYVVATLVNLKTRTGKFYMTLIKPFHKLVAKYSIAQALKSGRI